MSRYLIRFGMGGLAIFFITGALVYTLVVRSEESFWPGEKFTRERWNTMPDDQRYAIANDLVESRILDGMTKSDVILLLGRPDPGGMNEDGMIYDNISYLLKGGSTEFRFSMNSIYILRILFDPVTGEVLSYGIAGD